MSKVVPFLVRHIFRNLLLLTGPKVCVFVVTKVCSDSQFSCFGALQLFRYFKQNRRNCIARKINNPILFIYLQMSCLHLDTLIISHI